MAARWQVLHIVRGKEYMLKRKSHEHLLKDFDIEEAVNNEETQLVRCLMVYLWEGLPSAWIYSHVVSAFFNISVTDPPGWRIFSIFF